MSRRVLVVMFALAAVYLVTALAYGFVHASEDFTPTSSTTMQTLKLHWGDSGLPLCSATTTKSCAVSLNLLAFDEDGSAFVVASKLPPTATGAMVKVSKGTYNFWLVVSGYDADGDFNVTLPVSTGVQVTPADEKDIPKEPEPDPTPSSTENYFIKT